MNLSTLGGVGIGECPIYLNGTLANDEAGRSAHGLLTIADAARKALVPNGKNILAVHCHRARNNPFIDAGLALETALSTEK